MRKQTMQEREKEYQNHKAVALMMLADMPQAKKEILKKALYRNELLTSTYVLESGTLAHTKSGFYLTLKGTRASFSVYMDNELEFTRKPSNDEITREIYLKFDEKDFLNSGEIFAEKVVA